VKKTNHYREILSLVSRIGRLTNPRHLPVLKKIAIPLSQFLVLDALADGDGSMRMADLAEAAGLLPSELTRVLDDLEKKKWAVRAADPKDNRARLVKATQSGARLIAKAHDQAGEELMSVWSDFTHEEWHRFTDYLHRFAVGVKRVRSKKKPSMQKKSAKDQKGAVHG
jgi:DNA-binding MarR family transcriptional regulator